MILDPLCPQQCLPKHSPNRCVFCEYGAAVRLDEHSRIREAAFNMPQPAPDLRGNPHVGDHCEDCQ